MNSQEHLTSSDIESILKQNHIFDNIFSASRPRVIKVSPKSDMSIVWIDIWDVQSGSNTKMLINRYFNVGWYITTIQGANMNPGITQCKIVGNGVTQCSLVEFRGSSVSNAMVPTSPKIITTLGGAAMPMPKSIL